MEVNKEEKLLEIRAFKPSSPPPSVHHLLLII
jgi:hypothetical protein